ncbi:MAG: DNA translocase FtsK 4TM domain-containing protein [Rhodomicrobiaceae bacterium]
MSDYRMSDSGRILPGGMGSEIHRLPMRIVGGAILAMALFGWISLLTWSIGDPSLNRATDGAPSNLLGATGASLADMLFQLLGLSAISLFLPQAVWGLALLTGERVGNPRHRLAMWMLSVVLIASALSIMPKPPGWLLVHGLGGMIGDFGKSVFLGLGGLIHDSIAVPLGGAVAGALGFLTLLRACGVGRHELGLLARPGIGQGHGHSLGGAMLAGVSYMMIGVGKARRRFAKSLEREAVQGRGVTPTYWEPEDADRFNPAPDRRGSFNPRYGGYEIPDIRPVTPPPVQRAPRAQPTHIVQQTGDDRIEPYFENARLIPRQQGHGPAAPQYAPQSHAIPQAHPVQQWPAQPQHTPQYAHQPPQAAPVQQHVSPQFRHQQQAALAYPQHDAAYANENFEESAADDYYEEANGAYHVEQAHYAEPEPPAPVIRKGPRAVPMQPPMPDRSMRASASRAPEIGNWSAEEFTLPPLKLLTAAPPRQNDPDMSDSALGRRAEMLQSVLEDFRIKGQITGVHPGPVITLYEFEPARGTKSSRVIGLADDIARSMSAVSARVAVIPGRDAIGIELPNQNREIVYLRQLLEAKDFAQGKGRLQLALGKTIGGDPVIVDLARMPHLLIAGTTGSGKSVAINTMILSLLYRLPPEECRFIMIDPKMLELSVYDGIPHLLTPVVTDPHQAIKALKWTVAEMNSRYERMCKLGVRNIMGFNQKVARAQRTGEPLARTVQTGFDEETGSAIYERENIDPTPMPYIVVVIDEMADLMMVAGKDIEFAVQRLSQMARAAGIHLIMATQRPSVDVITGTIKANFPSRISFQVTSKIDSRTILGEMGAEQLLGAGDMLTMAAGGRIMRAHGPFVSDDEVEEIVNFLRVQGEPDYMYGVLDDDNGGDQDGGDDYSSRSGGANGAGSGDDVYNQAIDIVLRDKRPTTSYLQRRLGIGYNRAASLIERMETDGIISAPNRTGKREVLSGSDT